MCGREITLQEEMELLTCDIDEAAWQKTLEEYDEKYHPYIGRTVLGMRKLISLYVKHLKTTQSDNQP